MRLIDADALSRVMYHEAFETDTDMQRWDSGCWIRYKMFENAIEYVPTIDPVVHGEWVKGGYSIEVYYNCSICGNTVWGYNLPKYCDDCGAKMDGGEQRYEDEFDVCDSRNGCIGCEHHICKLEQTERKEGE